jgi:hypothetical protein
MSAGGAKMTLTLDRQIQYRAAPSAVCAWTHHDYQDAGPRHEPIATGRQGCAPPNCDDEGYGGIIDDIVTGSETTTGLMDCWVDTERNSDTMCLLVNNLDTVY